MYKLYFTESAINDLAKLDKPIAQRIFNKLNWYAKNFMSITLDSLSGSFKDKYKFRIGDYRAVYTINEKEKSILIHMIDHRREIYK